MVVTRRSYGVPLRCGALAGGREGQRFFQQQKRDREIILFGKDRHLAHGLIEPDAQAVIDAGAVAQQDVLALRKRDGGNLDLGRRSSGRRGAS